MNNPTDVKISKSDFLLYCEAPRHLWAKKNNLYEPSLSDFDLHLIEEGYKVEGLAREYLETVLPAQNPGHQILFQQTFSDGPFEARLDALILKPETGHYDLYEIKSGTSIDKVHLFDITYQVAILENQINVDRFYLLHPNKDYVRCGRLDLIKFFLPEDVTGKVIEFLPGIRQLRQEALCAALAEDPASLAHCLNPRECPCPDICHPELPAFSIFNIPYLSQKKKKELLDMGIRHAKDIPQSFVLNHKQRLVANCARTNSEYIDRLALSTEIEKITYPVYFLDYETCISAIPQYDGYHPQQQIVFQYSLHRMDQLGGEVVHTEYVSVTPDDPSLPLLEHLNSDMGGTGTIIVWNKTFEMTRNSEMAVLHPEYEPFLTNLNERIYDLGEIVNQGCYVHPGFKGSWSIKHVLPVLVPELSYHDLDIQKGEQASMVWWNITFKDLDECEKTRLVEGLEKYCQLDTRAMVDILGVFKSILQRK